MTNNLLKLYQSSESIAKSLSLKVTLSERGFCFQNRFDDELGIDPIILAYQDDEWLKETLAEIVE